MQRGKKVPWIIGKNMQATLNSCKRKVKQQQNTVITGMYLKDLLNILSTISMMDFQALVEVSIPPKRPLSTLKHTVTSLHFSFLGAFKQPGPGIGIRIQIRILLNFHLYTSNNFVQSCHHV
jgi:hypothetical protein